MPFVQVLLFVLAVYALYYLVMVIYEYFTVKERRTSGSGDEEVDISDIVESFKSVEIDNTYLSKKQHPKGNIGAGAEISAGKGFTPEELQEKVNAVYEQCQDKTKVIDEVQNMLDCWAYGEDRAA